jgi:formate hydrogenlyase subunit 6/NADH:ubiquinone oxidoreductase subunit I
MVGLDTGKQDMKMVKFGLMFSDVSGSLFHRPATGKYPFERQISPARLRSFLKWTPEACSGCGLCAMDCPANAIQVTMLDRKEKQFVISYHADRCLFCGQCVESCRQGSLSMINDHWELAALDKKPFTVLFGDADDIRKYLAGMPAGRPETPEKNG